MSSQIDFFFKSMPFIPSEIIFNQKFSTIKKILKVSYLPLSTNIHSSLCTHTKKNPRLNQNHNPPLPSDKS